MTSSDRRAQAAGLLVSLNQRGVRLSADGGAIRFRASTGALGEADRARISQFREEILGLLTGAQPRRLPLSDQQFRLWLLHERQGSSTEYQMTAAFRMHGPVDVGSFRAAVGAVVRRHPALRSVIEAEDGLPVMVARPAGQASLVIADATESAGAGPPAGDAVEPSEEAARGPGQRGLVQHVRRTAGPGRHRHR